MHQGVGFVLCAIGLLPVLLYSLIIFSDSSVKNRSLLVGLLSVPAAFVQLMGYGLGFIESWWKRCVLKRPEQIPGNETAEERQRKEEKFYQ